MTDDALEKILSDHVKALERVMAAPPRPSRFSDLTTIIAVLGLIVSIAQSWAITGKRLDDIERARVVDTATLARVPLIELTMQQVAGTLQRLENQSQAQGAQTQEMRDALIKLGMQIPERKIK